MTRASQPANEIQINSGAEEMTTRVIRLGQQLSPKSNNGDIVSRHMSPSTANWQSRTTLHSDKQLKANQAFSCPSDFTLKMTKKVKDMKLFAMPEHQGTRNKVYESSRTPRGGRSNTNSRFKTNAGASGRVSKFDASQTPVNDI